MSIITGKVGLPHVYGLGDENDFYTNIFKQNWENILRCFWFVPYIGEDDGEFFDVIKERLEDDHSNILIIDIDNLRQELQHRTMQDIYNDSEIRRHILNENGGTDVGFEHMVYALSKMVDSKGSTGGCCTWVRTKNGADLQKICMIPANCEFSVITHELSHLSSFPLKFDHKRNFVKVGLKCGKHGHYMNEMLTEQIGNDAAKQWEWAGYDKDEWFWGEEAEKKINVLASLTSSTGYFEGIQHVKPLFRVWERFEPLLQSYFGDDMGPAFKCFGKGEFANLCATVDIFYDTFRKNHCNELNREVQKSGRELSKTVDMTIASANRRAAILGDGGKS